MEIIEPGHIYRLNWLDGKPSLEFATVPGFNTTEADLIFVNREDNPHGGTQTQEVLRALIDRTEHCDACLRWAGNDSIVQYLRLALVLHEARALERKTLKGIINPEGVAVGPDGHFLLQGRQP